jgi:hypothetical protein
MLHEEILLFPQVASHWGMDIKSTVEYQKNAEDNYQTLIQYHRMNRYKELH